MNLGLTHSDENRRTRTVHAYYYLVYISFHPILLTIVALGVYTKHASVIISLEFRSLSPIMISSCAVNDVFDCSVKNPDSIVIPPETLVELTSYCTKLLSGCDCQFGVAIVGLSKRYHVPESFDVLNRSICLTRTRESKNPGFKRIEIIGYNVFVRVSVATPL